MRIIGMAIIGGLVLGCSDSTSPAVINGTYTLRTLRGDPLPAVVQEGTDYAFKITAGSITLNGDLTFSDSYSYWEYDHGTVLTGTVPCTGTWHPTSETKFSLSEIPIDGCGMTGVGEWDGRNHVTVAWDVIGTAVHGR